MSAFQLLFKQQWCLFHYYSFEAILLISLADVYGSITSPFPSVSFLSPPGFSNVPPKHPLTAHIPPDMRLPLSPCGIFSVLKNLYCFSILFLETLTHFIQNYSLKSILQHFFETDYYISFHTLLLSD